MNWFTHSGSIFKAFYPSLTWEHKTDQQCVYLTFDDGPTSEVTRYVLQVLNDFGFKATFFCIGENVEKHPSIYQDVLAQGHSVGNHTYNHLNGFKTSNQVYQSNTQKAAEVIDSKLFRPPFGRIKRKQIRMLKPQYEIVMWSILSGDFDTGLNVNRASRRIRSLTKPGAIIVFHDSQKAFANVKQLLPSYCTFLRDNGYTSCGL